MDKPNIVEVVSKYTHLRRSGRRYIGLCPLHDERTPSFIVNEDQGLFKCFGIGCGEGGDVFDFVMKKLGLDFKGARAHLGLSNTPHIHRPQKSKERHASEVVTSWASETPLVLTAKMRALLEQARLAKACLSIEGVDATLESCERQWEILNILDEDLFNPQLLLGLWVQRESIEGIIINE